MVLMVIVDGVDTELAVQIATEMEGSQIEVNRKHLTIRRKSIAIIIINNKAGLKSRGSWPLHRWSKEHGILMEYIEVQSTKVLTYRHIVYGQSTRALLSLYL